MLRHFTEFGQLSDGSSAPAITRPLPSPNSYENCSWTRALWESSESHTMNGREWWSKREKRCWSIVSCGGGNQCAWERERTLGRIVALASANTASRGSRSQLPALRRHKWSVVEAFSEIGADVEFQCTWIDSANTLTTAVDALC
jgi:hypothetical protein